MSITEQVTEMVPQLMIGGVVSLLGLALMLLLVSAFGGQQGVRKRIGVMCGGLFGVLLGTVALVIGEVVISPETGPSLDVTAGEPSPDEARKAAGGGGMMGGMGGGGGGMMGGMGGGGGGGGMMGGRGGGSRESGKRDLTTLVRKLELLTGEVSVKLSEEQIVSVTKKLVALGGEKSLNEEQAKAAYEELQELLTDVQQEQLKKISLPRSRGGRRGGGFGGGGRSGPPPGAQTGDGGSGEAEQEEGNPFTESANGKALLAFLERFGVAPPDLEVEQGSEEETRPVGGAGEAILRNFDKDKDGTLTREEAPSFVKSRFDAVDSNKDGRVDLEELKAVRRRTSRE